MKTHASVMILTSFMSLSTMAVATEPQRARPVIFDTDIGGDIDDTWALALLLASPELDLKLVVTDSHNTLGKAKIVAKLLERAGRTDVPIGIGLQQNDHVGAQQSWTGDVELAKYPGKVHEDGVQAIIDTIRGSSQTMTLIAVGPVPNLAEALRRDPQLTDRAQLIVMGGSVDRQYGGKPGRCAEYNVVSDAKAAQVVYGAAWPVTMAPLDTAGIVRLTGASFARVRDADNPLAQAVIENYRIWATQHQGADVNRASSILFDTVAVYLAFDRRLCQMRDIRLRVTDDGITQPAADGKLTHVAMDWNDLDAFHDLVANRIAGFQNPVRQPVPGNGR